MLDPEQVHLLRRTFARVEERPVVAALIFYRRLFELDPGLRPLFHADIEQQAAKLMDMLGWSLSMLERPATLLPELEQLGARHVHYGVRDEHYETVGTALLDMFGEVLDRDFTPAVRAAWTGLYALVAEAMQRGAARVSAADALPSAGSGEERQAHREPGAPARR